MESDFGMVAALLSANWIDPSTPHPYLLPQGEKEMLDNLLKETGREAHRLSPLPLREGVG
jgi:hypothetical protein